MTRENRFHIQVGAFEVVPAPEWPHQDFLTALRTHVYTKIRDDRGYHSSDPLVIAVWNEARTRYEYRTLTFPWTVDGIYQIIQDLIAQVDPWA